MREYWARFQLLEGAHSLQRTPNCSCPALYEGISLGPTCLWTNQTVSLSCYVSGISQGSSGRPCQSTAGMCLAHNRPRFNSWHPSAPLGTCRCSPSGPQHGQTPSCPRRPLHWNDRLFGWQRISCVAPGPPKHHLGNPPPKKGSSE